MGTRQFQHPDNLDIRRFHQDENPWRQIQEYKYAQHQENHGCGFNLDNTRAIHQENKAAWRSQQDDGSTRLHNFEERYARQLQHEENHSLFPRFGLSSFDEANSGMSSDCEIVQVLIQERNVPITTAYMAADIQEKNQQQQPVQQEGKEIEELEEANKKVGILEKIKKPTEKYNWIDQEIKSRDLWEQDIVKFFEGHSNAVKLFDKKLNRKFLNGVFFHWCGRWSFDPGRIPQSTQMELFSNFNYGKKNLGWVENLTLMVKPK
jgi:hypothetical protein